MKPSPPNAAKSRRPATRWVAVLLLVLALYAVLQPVANRQFGWQLPSLASLAQQAADGSERPDRSRSPAEVEATNPSESSSSIRIANGRERSGADTYDSQSSSVDSSRRQDDMQFESDLADSGQETASGASAEPNVRGPPAESLGYGYLKQIGPEDFLSPAGLRYTRGSEEGHRLRHIAKHLVDQPDRPGSHGVFQADMPQVLQWIDEVYQRAQQDEPGTSKRQEQDRWVLEASFDEPVGFMGGSTGQRRGHPPTHQIRLVVEDKRVITAFPF